MSEIRLAGQIIGRLFAAVGAADQEAFVACFEADGSARAVASGPMHTGHHELRAMFHALLGSVSRITVSEELRVAWGATMAVAWRGSGTELDGRAFDASGLLVLELGRDGRIRRAWNHCDRRETGLTEPEVPLP